MYSYENGYLYDEDMTIVGVLRERNKEGIRTFVIETQDGTTVAMESINNAVHEGRLLLSNPDSYKAKNGIISKTYYL